MVNIWAIAAAAALGVMPAAGVHLVTVRAEPSLHAVDSCQNVVVDVIGRGTLTTDWEMPASTVTVDGHLFREYRMPMAEQSWWRVTMRFRDGTVREVIGHKEACADAYN